jgi:peptidoglycan hydrolase-like protein with peptidoglycan-binding domain
LAEAHRRWSGRINRLPRQVPAEQLLSADEVRGVQQQLTELGYAPGKLDGIWGPRTTGALAAFQSHEGLVADGQYTAETKTKLAAALQMAGARIVASEQNIVFDTPPIK